MKINNKWYPQSTLVGNPISTAQIAKRLAAESTVAPADIYTVKLNHADGYAEDDFEKNE